MDAVEYVKQRERMCDSYGDCDKCRRDFWLKEIE